MGLLAGGNSVGAGRPHAYSMQQTTASDLKGINLNRWGSSNGSPTLKPITGDQTNLSAAADDVRSLLYCASDSDEIESLVFNQAEHHCIDEEEAEDEQQHVQKS